MTHMGSGQFGSMLSGTTGPYASCAACLTPGGVTTVASYDCDGQGICTDPGNGQGQYTDANSGGNPGDGYSACQAACVPALVRYRCHDCTTPCAQNVINAGYCPYTTVSSCMQACADTNKWTCGMPDKFGNPKCRKCKQFELTNGTDCYNTKQLCLDSNCPGKLAPDKHQMQADGQQALKKSSPDNEDEEVIDNIDLIDLRENMKKELKMNLRQKLKNQLENCLMNKRGLKQIMRVKMEVEQH